MTTFEPLDYVFDFSDRHNCSCIESAEPGKPMRVRVRHAQDATAPTLVATLTRSLDGEQYSVEVITPDGKRTLLGATTRAFLDISGIINQRDSVLNGWQG